MYSVECNVEDSVFEYRVYDDYGISIIAYARVLRTEEWAEIKVINVNREYRGRGIGSILLTRIVKDHSNCTIIVETFKYLIDWYKRFNFKLVCENPVIMMKHESQQSL
ncbi:MAG: GNAT family N-acetyltransferase [Candidatus Jordarchaeales archaeon]